MITAEQYNILIRLYILTSKEYCKSGPFISRLRMATPWHSIPEIREEDITNIDFDSLQDLGYGGLVHIIEATQIPRYKKLASSHSKLWQDLYNHNIWISQLEKSILSRWKKKFSRRKTIEKKADLARFKEKHQRISTEYDDLINTLDKEFDLKYGSRDFINLIKNLVYVPHHINVYYELQNGKAARLTDKGKTALSEYIEKVLTYYPPSIPRSG